MSALAIFSASSLTIIIAGIFLARSGDSISRKSRIGLLFIGVVFVALATSLPELATDVFAALQGNPNLAMGDILGSSLFNMMILAIIDLIYLRSSKRRLEPAISVLRKVTIDHALTVCIAIGVTALAAMFILLRANLRLSVVGIPTLLILTVYLFGMWLIFTKEREKIVEQVRGIEGEPMGRDIALFAVASFLILIAAPNLSSSAKVLAQISGLGNTFFGTFFLALITSFPELVVGIEAMRIGAFDLAVGNLFGSNALNIAILFAVDIAVKGALFSLVSPVHAVTALIAILLMTTALIGLLMRAEKRIFFAIPDAYLMLIIFLGGYFILKRIS